MEDRYSTRRGSSERENRFFSNRIRFMDLFMTLCVAAMHISYNAGREDIITNIMKNASGGAMGWFFFMSSFWYFKDYDHGIAWKKFKKRLRKILIPYIIWNTIEFMRINGKAIVKAGSFFGFEKKWLIGLMFTRFNGLEYMPIDGPLWYIIRLLGYFLVSPLIYFCIKDKKAGILSIVTCFFLTRNGGYYHFDGWLCLFMVGAYVGLHYRKAYVTLFTHFNLDKGHRRLGLIGIIIVYTILTIIWQTVLGAGIQMWAGIHYFIAYLMAAIPIVIFDAPKVKSEVAGYSFGIYCGHMVLVPLFNKILSRVDNFFPIAGGLWAMILLSAVCIFIVIMYKTLKTISPRLEALFTGGR